MARTNAGTDPGFTLIEVVVALVISAAIAAIAVNAAVEARARAQVATAKQAAVIVAHNLLERGVGTPFTGQPQQGRDDQLSWTVSETPIGGPFLNERWQRVRTNLVMTSDSGVQLLALSRVRLAPLEASQ